MLMYFPTQFSFAKIQFPEEIAVFSTCLPSSPFQRPTSLCWPLLCKVPPLIRSLCVSLYSSSGPTQSTEDSRGEGPPWVIFFSSRKGEITPPSGEYNGKKEMKAYYFVPFPVPLHSWSELGE